MTVDGVVVMGSLNVGGRGCSGGSRGEVYTIQQEVDNKSRTVISD